MSTPAITVSANNYTLHEDIDKDLFEHDFEHSMYDEDEVEEYIIDFLDTHHIFYFIEKEGNETKFFFDASNFSGAIEMKYDNYGIDY